MPAALCGHLQVWSTAQQACVCGTNFQGASCGSCVPGSKGASCDQQCGAGDPCSCGDNKVGCCLGCLVALSHLRKHEPSTAKAAPSVLLTSHTNDAAGRWLQLQTGRKNNYFIIYYIGAKPKRSCPAASRCGARQPIRVPVPLVMQRKVLLARPAAAETHAVAPQTR
jgi:hypothetical protein